MARPHRGKQIPWSATGVVNLSRALMARPHRGEKVDTQLADCRALFRALTARLHRGSMRLGLPYTMHTLRHRFGTSVYVLTKDMVLTQDIMRHGSPETTRRATSPSGRTQP